MPTCLVVQHAEPEGPYAIGDALRSAGVTVDVRRVFDGDRLPADLQGFDGLVVMGGPASATTDDGFPTRRQELDLLAGALGGELPVLAVCLGAQLLALAAGGSVRAGEAGPEIGWGGVELNGDASTDPLLAGLPTDPTVLHWHGDTFALPSTATHLATSARYPNQAFRVGDRAWGLQFHLEVNAEAVDAFLAAFGHEVRTAGLDPEAIRADSAPCLRTLAPLRDRVVDRFASLVVGLHRDPEPAGHH
jgi:GMP synthase-like glutamine amidotransferase